MNRSIEQALTSLIPRCNGAFPLELIELSSSLLAQSRNKASNLKAEEEIGRTYACANIACERLKAALDLPPIEVRPPCPPRVYKKLYSYFTSILSTQKRTRGSTNRADTLALRVTPRKERALAVSRTNKLPRQTPSRSQRYGLQYDVSKDVSSWVPIVVRRLCGGMDSNAAFPSVMAGVSSCLTLPAPKPKDGGSDDNARGSAPALIGAIYLFVRTRLVGKELDGSGYVSAKRKLLRILEDARSDEELRASLLAKSKGQSEDFSDWVAATNKDLESWMLKIVDEGWLELDWFSNVVQGAGLGCGDIVDNAVGASGDTDHSPDQTIVSNDGLQSGLGTMIQPSLDYLSEKKKGEYLIWKAGIMARIDEIQTRSNVMDTT